MSQCNCGCAHCAAKSSEVWNEWGGSEMFEYLSSVWKETRKRAGSARATAARAVRIFELCLNV